MVFNQYGLLYAMFAINYLYIRALPAFCEQ